MTVYFDTFSTPAGLFSVGVNSAGALVATAFGDQQALVGRLPPSQLIEDSRRTSKARTQIKAYFAGKRRDFDLELAPGGTEFQGLVWAALQRIPFGQTATYGAIAQRIKRPQAARAVGRANATNPICLVVPCHRVIGANGSLTGFAFGERLKQTLLEHEGARSR